MDSLRPTNLVSLRTGNRRLFIAPAIGALRTPTLTAEEVKDVPMPKIDKSGRLSSPRAARELALYGVHSRFLLGSENCISLVELNGIGDFSDWKLKFD